MNCTNHLHSCILSPVPIIFSLVSCHLYQSSSLLYLITCTYQSSSLLYLITCNNHLLSSLLSPVPIIFSLISYHLYQSSSFLYIITCTNHLLSCILSALDARSPPKIKLLESDEIRAQAFCTKRYDRGVTCVRLVQDLNTAIGSEGLWIECKCRLTVTCKKLHC